MEVVAVRRKTVSKLSLETCLLIADAPGSFPAAVGKFVIFGVCYSRYTLSLMDADVTALC